MGEKKIDPVLDGMEFSIVHFAGAEKKDKVFEGKKLEEVSAYDPTQKARWVKGAMERLDALVDERTRGQIMGYCGAMCAAVWTKNIEAAKVKLKERGNLDEYLRAEGIPREGDAIYPSYTPYKDGRRCYCLGNDLPAEETMSSTYCLCGAGHAKAFWEGVLERPVKVELLQSAISGARECKFAVHLIEKAPEGQFKCNVCGVAFETASELKEHERVSQR